MLSLKNYIGIGIVVLIFLASIFMTFALPIYAIYNFINTYKLDKSDQNYIIADVIYITRGGRGGGVYNFKVEDDNKIYRKNYWITSSKLKKINVKFNENKTYWIIENHIIREYIDSTIFIIISGFYAYISFTLFKVIKEIKNHI